VIDWVIKTQGVSFRFACEAVKSIKNESDLDDFRNVNQGDR
tara:strand:- start:104 stop:226 length:123 start_codon:yes stop_codon:yes gene_type:complete